MLLSVADLASVNISLTHILDLFWCWEFEEQLQLVNTDLYIHWLSRV
jgi:hypothetical protein